MKCYQSHKCSMYTLVSYEHNPNLEDNISLQVFLSILNTIFKQLWEGYFWATFFLTEKLLYVLLFIELLNVQEIFFQSRWTIKLDAIFSTFTKSVLTINLIIIKLSGGEALLYKLQVSHLLRSLLSCVCSSSDVVAAGMGGTKLGPLGSSGWRLLLRGIPAPPVILLFTILVYNSVMFFQVLGCIRCIFCCYCSTAVWNSKYINVKYIITCI